MRRCVCIWQYILQNYNYKPVLLYQHFLKQQHHNSWCCMGTPWMPAVGVKNILFPRDNQNYELKLLFLFLMGWAFAHLWGLIRLVHNCKTWILREIHGICKLFSEKEEEEEDGDECKSVFFNNNFCTHQIPRHHEHYRRRKSFTISKKFK